MKISVKIFIGFLALLLLFTIATVINYRLTEKVSENTNWLTTSEVVIRNSNRMHRNITEMQSSFRGFLLTGDSSYLRIYLSSHNESESVYKELEPLITKNSFQHNKLLTIKQLHEFWKDSIADPVIAFKLNADYNPATIDEYKILYNNVITKGNDENISFKIQESFKEFNTREYALRQKRREVLTDSLKATRSTSIFLNTISILLGLASAFYVTRVISKRISKMVDLADTISKGDFNVQITDTQNDELSHLSSSLNIMAKRLKESFYELEKKNKELDQFAYVVSHDLKAPLRGIDNASHWIEEDYGGDMPEKLKEYLQMMRGRVHRMENLIDGILQIARIGKIKKEVQRVDVYKLITEIIELLDPPKKFNITVQKNLPVFITEKISLEQVFQNLISNAIKYNDKIQGKINITYKDIDKFYEFIVSDNGPGIEDEYHDKVFVIFQTLQERDKFESTGVGLAIVKKIIEDQAGTIRVVSEVGEGTSFIFTWPKEPLNIF